MDISTFSDYEYMKLRPCLFIICIVLCALYGCSHSSTAAPVESFSPPPSTKVRVHRVQPGDTLYSIAWRYNLEYRKLAKANGISDTYRIYPGQQLFLTDLERRIERYASIQKKRQKLKATQIVPTPKPKLSPKAKSKPPTEVAKINLNKRLIKKPIENKKTTNVKLSKSPSTWVWPTNGFVGQGFNSNKGLNKGIDLFGKLGDSVRASAAGEVVYAGHGLRGYGLLVIVKHSEKFLSAYAHNNKILVSEGDTVTQGQKIAELGSTDADRVKLHFEIRRDGKPVDPLKYLPSKK